MFEILIQIPIGFFVALSGALIPGPLLAYVTAKSTEEGRQIGPLVVVGHLAVEVVILLLLLAGIGYVLAHPLLERTIGLTGGFLLILIASSSLRSLRARRYKIQVTCFHPFVGGVLFSSIFNPTVPLWWVGVGFALLLQAYSVASFAGVAAWLIGHYAADFGWFSLVSHLVSSSHAAVEKIRILLLRICVVILLLLGLYLVVKYSVFF
ncbi:MAG: LysE family transporter [Candidatus Hadarchaeales archaeon]